MLSKRPNRVELTNTSNKNRTNAENKHDIERTMENYLKVKLTFMAIMRTVDVILHQFLGLLITDHDSNVLPRGGAPVRKIVAFLRDFIAIYSSSSVLTRVKRTISGELLVSGEQTCTIRKTLRFVLRTNF